MDAMQAVWRVLSVPMILLKDPHSFEIVTLLSAAVSYLAYRRSRSLGAPRWAWTHAALVAAPLGWLAMACFEMRAVLPGLTADAIRVDLVLLAPVAWLLAIVQAVAVVRSVRRR